MQPDRTVLLESVKNPLQFITVGPDGAPGEVRGILDKEPTRRYYVYAKVGTLEQLLKIQFLFDLIIYVPSTIFRLNRDWSSWVEPVLS